jgi:hypothetical protein
VVGRHEPALEKAALVFMVVTMNGCVCHYRCLLLQLTTQPDLSGARYYRGFRMRKRRLQWPSLIWIKINCRGSEENPRNLGHEQSTCGDCKTNFKVCGGLFGRRCRVPP